MLGRRWNRWLSATAISVLWAGSAAADCNIDDTQGVAARLEALELCAEAALTENADLKAQLEQTQSRLTALSRIVQDLVDDDGMARANNRIRDLEARLGQVDQPTAQVNANVIPAIGNHIGTRAVIAFTSEKGERTCPPGWKPFEEAKDRFILGAGNKYQVVGDTGGAEEVKLEERHTPLHSHGVTEQSHSHVDRYISDDNRGNEVGYGGLRGVLGNNRTTRGNKTFLEVDEFGPGEPHENMPPWIALYYCIKE